MAKAKRNKTTSKTRSAARLRNLRSSKPLTARGGVHGNTQAQNNDRPVDTVGSMGTTNGLVAINQERYNKYWHRIAIVALLVLGAYQSYIFFAHQVVPNSDFPGFVAVGKSLLSFEVPESFKRAPVLGILQVALSKCIGGNHPVLTAGWLLNALLYPINLLLFYLIGCHFLADPFGIVSTNNRKHNVSSNGKTRNVSTIPIQHNWLVFGLTLLLAFNPFMLAMLVQPIVETTLIFFFLMTLLLILRRSRWAYVFAALASLTRYEGAALILVSFLADVISPNCPVGKTSANSNTAAKTALRAYRIRSFIYAFIASLPLIIWLSATVHHYYYVTAASHSSSANTSLSHIDYIRNYGHGTSFVEFLGYLWKAGFAALLSTTASVKQLFSQPHPLYNNLPVYALSKIIVTIGIIVGIVATIIKRQWHKSALVLFFIIYILLHGSRNFTRLRYAVPIAWLALLLCTFGLKNIIAISLQKIKPPAFARQLLLWLVFILSVVWMATIITQLINGVQVQRGAMGFVSFDMSQLCTPARYLVILGLILVLANLLYRLFVAANNGSQRLPVTLAGSAILALMLVSSQFNVVRTLGNGKKDVEFKLLADWYINHAKPSEKMLTSMPSIVKLYAPRFAANFIHIKYFRANTPQDFIRKCRQAHITYIAWDSRIGLRPKYNYYHRWGIKNIASLAQPKDHPPFKYITTIFYNRRQYINIFRLIYTHHD